MQGHYYTPDFLVLRLDGVAFEEWKTEDELHRPCREQPYRYQRGEDGTWHCPPAEELTRQLSVSFRVCSSAMLTPTYIDNLDFLADYFISPPPIPERIVSFVRCRVQESPGMSMATLPGEGVGLRPHDMYALIALDQLFADLNQVSLRDHNRTLLYPDQHTAAALASPGHASLVGRLERKPAVFLSFHEYPSVVGWMHLDTGEFGRNHHHASSRERGTDSAAIGFLSPFARITDSRCSPSGSAKRGKPGGC